MKLLVSCIFFLILCCPCKADNTIELSGTVALSADHYHSGLSPLLSPYMLDSDPDGEPHSFLVAATTLAAVAKFQHKGFQPTVTLTGDLWQPLINSQDDRFIREQFYLREANIALPIGGSSKLTIGRDRFIIGWQEPSESPRIGLPLLCHSGNLWGYYPQVKIEIKIRKISLQLALMQIEGQFRDAEEYLKREKSLGWSLDGPTTQEFRLVLNLYRESVLGISAHFGDNEIEGTKSEVHDSFVYMLEWNFLLQNLRLKGDVFRTESNQMFLGNAGYIDLLREHSAWGGWSELSWMKSDKYLVKFGWGSEILRSEDILLRGEAESTRSYYLGLDYSLPQNFTLNLLYENIKTEYHESDSNVNHRLFIACSVCLPRKNFGVINSPY